MLSSQSRLLGSNPVVWLCDQEPVRTFQKGPPPEKAKLRRWWTYLSQLRLSVHHIQGVKNECADNISRNNFDNMIGARSEELANEAFSWMDVHLHLNMTMIRPLDGLRQVEYLKEFQDIYKRLEKHLEPVLVNQEQWKRDETSLWHKDRIVVPSDRILALPKWTHEPSGHVGANRTLRLFKQWFHSTWTDDQVRKTLQPIVDKCPCWSCKPEDIRDRGLYSTLPIPLCANSVLYVDYTENPKFGGSDFALVVTCGLTRFTRVFPCTTHITGEETIKILLWFVSWELDLYSCASLFLKIQNPKSTNLAGSLDGAPIHNTISKTKTLFRDRGILQRSFTQLAFDASLLFTDCSAIATASCDLRAHCAAAAPSHNTTPPLRPRRGLTHLGGCHNVKFAEQALKKKPGPPHALATEI